MKYSTKEFKYVFEVHEEKVTSSKNQYTRASKSGDSERTGVERSEDEEIEEASEDKLDDERCVGEAGIEEVLEVDDEMADQGVDTLELANVDFDYNFNMNDSVDLTNDREVPPKKSKYIHERLERSIKPIKKLREGDFKSLQFTGKDLKALKLILELGAVQDSFVDFIQSFVTEKDKVDGGSKADDTEDPIIINRHNLEEDNNKNMSEKDSGQEPKNKEDEHQSVEKISNRKLYKKAVLGIMEENDNKVKMKKLKKQVLEKCLEFDQDDIDSDMRKARVDKYINKVKGLVVEGKYAILQ